MISWLLAALGLRAACCAGLVALWRSEAGRSQHSASQAKAAQRALRMEQAKTAKNEQTIANLRRRLADTAKLHEQHIAQLKATHEDHLTEALAAAEAKARLAVDPSDLVVAAAAMNRREAEP